MDVGGVVLDRQITSELGLENLGKYVGVLRPVDFRPVCEKVDDFSFLLVSDLKNVYEFSQSECK